MPTIENLRDLVVSVPVPSRELDKHEFAAKRHAAILRAANVLASLGLGLGPGNIAVRNTLPFNDLSLDGMTLGAGGADSRDQWVLPGLTQGTNLVWINVAVPTNRVVCIYGCFYDSAAPSVSVVRLERGSGVAQEFQVEHAYPDLENVIYFPQLVTHRPQETCFVRVVPRVTVAAGQRFGLLAVTAEPRGQRVNGGD